jgi:hypothetical protein
MSCTKARAVLSETETKVVEEVDAKQEVITTSDVWTVLSRADKIYVASGQKILTYEPNSSNRDELIKKTTGRTGNLRAPALKIGNELYVGFNTSMYDSLGR